MTIPDSIAIACLVWYSMVILVCSIGIWQIRRNTLTRPVPSVSNTHPLERVPHVSIIRPVKGIEPYLYECLAATFYQTYPAEQLTVYFCVSSRKDPAFSILERLLSDFPACDANILVEEEDPNLSGRNGISNNLGPNPKIRNMSRAYREAKGDIVWIIDCNVWVSPPVLARMVDLLCGFTVPPESHPPTPPPAPRKYKFVHQLPLVVDVSTSPLPHPTTTLSSGSPATPSTIILPSGSHLEELFLSTSHAKFYTAISAVAIAPCIVGKSNMFRRSYLNALTTTPSASPSASSTQEMHDPGIDFFSDNICEDHLIGDLLWRSPVPSHIQKLAQSEGCPPNSPPPSQQAKWRNHGLLSPHPSNLATQPMSHTPLTSYIDRRTRWLRVRKFTVTAATFVEPGTESLLCSAYGAWGLTTLPWCHDRLGIPQSWSAFWMLWALSVMMWAMSDRYVWCLLQRRGTGGEDERPRFGRTKGYKRPLGQWLTAWLGREILAFPIWCWAVVGGTTVVWRGRRLKVGTDMRVHELDGAKESEMNGGMKGRVD